MSNSHEKPLPENIIIEKYSKWVNDYSMSHKTDSAHLEEIARDAFEAGIKIGIQLNIRS